MSYGITVDGVDVTEYISKLKYTQNHDTLAIDGEMESSLEFDEGAIVKLFKDSTQKFEAEILEKTVDMGIGYTKIFSYKFRTQASELRNKRITLTRTNDRYKKMSDLLVEKLDDAGIQYEIRGTLNSFSLLWDRTDVLNISMTALGFVNGLCFANGWIAFADNNKVVITSDDLTGITDISIDDSSVINPKPQKLGRVANKIAVSSTTTYDYIIYENNDSIANFGIRAMNIDTAFLNSQNEASIESILWTLGNTRESIEFEYMGWLDATQKVNYTGSDYLSNYSGDYYIAEETHELIEGAEEHKYKIVAFQTKVEATNNVGNTRYMKAQGVLRDTTISDDFNVANDVEVGKAQTSNIELAVEDLSNTSIDSKQDGEVLMWSETDNAWINNTVSIASLPDTGSDYNAILYIKNNTDTATREYAVDSHIVNDLGNNNFENYKREDTIRGYSFTKDDITFSIVMDLNIGGGLPFIEYKIKDSSGTLQYDTQMKFDRDSFYLRLAQDDVNAEDGAEFLVSGAYGNELIKFSPLMNGLQVYFQPNSFAIRDIASGSKKLEITDSLIVANVTMNAGGINGKSLNFKAWDGSSSYGFGVFNDGSKAGIFGYDVDGGGNFSGERGAYIASEYTGSAFIYNLYIDSDRIYVNDGSSNRMGQTQDVVLSETTLHFVKGIFVGTT